MIHSNFHYSREVVLIIQHKVIRSSKHLRIKKDIVLGFFSTPPPPITHVKGPIFRLDEYALKILRKGCPLENTVAFVDGSHVPGILLETQSLLFK